MARALPALVACAAFLEGLRALFPGVLTPDSIFMLQQARGLIPVNNWHPPMITALWGVLWWLLQDHGLVWAAQLAALLGALYLLAMGMRGRLRPPLFLACVVAAPPVIGVAAALWKDDWFCIAGLYAFALLRRGERDPSRPHLGLRVGAALFTAFFISIRYNALFAALPLLLALGLELRAWQARSGSKLPGRVVVAAFLGLLVGGNALLGALYARRHYAMWELPPLYDLTGISVRTGEVMVPPYIAARAPPTLEGLKRSYTDRTSDPLFWPQGGYNFPIDLPDRPRPDATDEGRGLPSLWLSAILHHPGAWLAHRLEFSRRLFAWRVNTCAAYPTGIVGNGDGWTFTRTQANIDLYWYLDRHANSFWFRPWVYLVALAGCALFSLRAKVRWSTRALIASGIFCLVSNAFLLAACDFRYSLWGVYALFTALFWLWEDRDAAGDSGAGMAR